MDLASHVLHSFLGTMFPVFFCYQPALSNIDKIRRKLTKHIINPVTLSDILSSAASLHSRIPKH